jgi:hypothetical protein
MATTFGTQSTKVLGATKSTPQPWLCPWHGARLH